MLSQSALIQRFRNGAKSRSASNMFIEGNVIYSYGHHFPLAIRKDWGAGITYLIRVREDNFSDVIGDRLYTLALIRRQRRRAPQTSQHYRWLFF